MTYEAITCICRDNSTDPVLEYFSKLKWDGVPRLDAMLHKYLRAADTALNAAIGRKMMCAIVRRAKKPGCKYNHQTVLQSHQGTKKSSPMPTLHLRRSRRVLSTPVATVSKFLA